MFGSLSGSSPSWLKQGHCKETPSVESDNSIPPSARWTVDSAYCKTDKSRFSSTTTVNTTKQQRMNSRRVVDMRQWQALLWSHLEPFTWPPCASVNPAVNWVKIGLHLQTRCCDCGFLSQMINFLWAKQAEPFVTMNMDKTACAFAVRASTDNEGYLFSLLPSAINSSQKIQFRSCSTNWYRDLILRKIVKSWPP